MLLHSISFRHLTFQITLKARTFVVGVLGAWRGVVFFGVFFFRNEVLYHDDNQSTGFILYKLPN